MAFHGYFASMPHMCHPVGVPQGFAHQHPYSGMHANWFPCWNLPPSTQHPAPSLPNRIEFLETQLAQVQREKDSMHGVIKYLLAELGALAATTKQPCPNCRVLKLRVALQSKATDRWRGKYREAMASLLAKEVRYRHPHNSTKPANDTSLTQNSSSSGDNFLIGTQSPDNDLLSGNIPISVIEHFPAASSFNTDPPSAETPPDFGTSADDHSSESETESVNYASVIKHSQLPVISTQQEGYKVSLSGAALPGNEDPWEFAIDSFSSKDELPYVRYFSGAVAPPASAVSDEIGGKKEHEHMKDIAISASLNEAFSGPVSVAAGPRVLRALKSDVLTCSSSSESAEQASPLTTTGSSLEHSNHTLFGGIRWAVMDGNDKWKKRLFATERERENAIAMNRKLAGQEDVMFPDIFRYGIRYNPESTAQDVYRTVLIEGLPPTVTLEKVLKKVRGGSVLSTKLCDTYSITCSCSALITFLSESAAYQYEAFAIRHAIYISGVAVKVSVLKTPTWPMTMPLRKAIFDHHHTRCLKVTNLPSHIDLYTLQLDLRVCASMDCDMIEFLGVRDDGTLEIRFSSVNAAGQAFGLLNLRAKYRPCSVRYSPDPCALPVDTLLEQAESDSSGVSDDSGTYNDGVPEELFADDERVDGNEEHAEENEAESLNRCSSSEVETRESEAMHSQTECIDTFGSSVLV